MNPVLLNHRYRILQELGMGGFGQTFLAEDTQMPSKRRCVIKQLKPVTGNPQIYQMVQERFAREAAVLEQLGDGNAQIPKLFAYFELDGQFYLVQEWIEGGTLAKKVQTVGTLSEAQVRSLLTKILPVLGYVHSFRMVHRDIKPDNIMLRPSGSFSPGEDIPVLIDFGAVKETMATAMSTSGGVTNSIAIGSPGFMSAEQAAGRPVYSSDLYSLGLTAIYMLTGKIPLEFPTDPATGEILWRQYAPTVSPGLAMVLDRSIRFNPRDRFPTAQGMLDALRPDVNSQVSTVAVAPVNRPVGNPPPYPRSPQPVIPTRGVSPVGNPPPYPRSPQPVIPARAIGIAAAVLGISFLIGFAIAQQKISSDSPIATPPANNPPPVSPPPYNPPPRETPPIYSEPTPVVVPPAEPEPPVVVPPVEPETPVVVPPVEPEPPVVVPPVEPETPVVVPPVEPEPPVSEIPSQPAEPEGDRPTPEESVFNYYSSINNRDYSQAWNQLEPRFQNNQSGDYNTYTTWWDSVGLVNVEEVDVVASSPSAAIVDTSLTYTMQDGRISNETIRMSLIWNEQTGTWAIEQTSRL